MNSRPGGSPSTPRVPPPRESPPQRNSRMQAEERPAAPLPDARPCPGTLCHSFSSRGSSRLSCSGPSVRELLLGARASFLPSSRYLARMTGREVGASHGRPWVRGAGQRLARQLQPASPFAGSSTTQVSGDHRGPAERGQTRPSRQHRPPRSSHCERVPWDKGRYQCGRFHRPASQPAPAACFPGRYVPNAGCGWGDP